MENVRINMPAGRDIACPAGANASSSTIGLASGHAGGAKTELFPGQNSSAQRRK